MRQSDRELEFCANNRDSGERNKVVLTEALENEKHGRCFSSIGDEMWPLRWNRKGLAPLDQRLFFRVLEEDADRTLDDVKSVVNIVVVMPRNFLGGADLQLGNAEARTRSVIRSALDLIQPAGILHRSYGYAVSTSMMWPFGSRK
jgi:hypothetical protein